MIRSFIRISVLALVATVAAACSSSESPGSGDAGLSGGGAGGGKGSNTGGKSASGGGGEGGGGMACTTADAGSDNCRQCLASSCCSDFTDCMRDAQCTKALADHEACFRTPGQEMSFCFGNFTRALEGDAGESGGLPPLGICIIMNCRAVCGGPGAV